MSGPNAKFKDETGGVVKERFKDFLITFTPGGADKTGDDQDGTIMSGTAMSQYKVSIMNNYYYYLIITLPCNIF